MAPDPPTRRVGGGLLVITVDACWPPVSGSDLRSWQNASAAARSRPVTLASLRAPPPAPPPPVSGLSIVGLCEPGFEKFWRRPWGGTRIDLTIPPEVPTRLAALVAKIRPSCALIEGLPLHPLMAPLRQTVPSIIMDMHNVESDLMARLLGGRAPWTALRRAYHRAAIRAIEQAAAERADAIWVCSADDRDRLRGFLHRAPPIQVVPNGIPRSESMPIVLPPLRDAGPRRPLLLFAGHLSYPPNVAAAEILARRILPEVRHGLPAARLVLAGRSPSQSVQALASETVTIVADPPNMVAQLARADFAVMPITAAGGTRLKALEAMAWGLPIVASAMAVEGLDVRDRAEVRLAERPRDFAAAIAQLWLDPVARNAQRQRAWLHARAAFGPKAIERAVEDGLALVQPRTIGQGYDDGR